MLRVLLLILSSLLSLPLHASSVDRCSQHLQSDKTLDLRQLAPQAAISLKPYLTQTTFARDVRLSADGQMIVLLVSDGSIASFFADNGTIKTGHPLSFPKIGPSPTQLTISPDRARSMVIGQPLKDHRIVLDLGNDQGEISYLENMQSGFSADGSIIYSFAPHLAHPDLSLYSFYSAIAGNQIEQKEHDELIKEMDLSAPISVHTPARVLLIRHQSATDELVSLHFTMHLPTGFKVSSAIGKIHLRDLRSKFYSPKVIATKLSYRGGLMAQVTSGSSLQTLRLHRLHYEPSPTPHLSPEEVSVINIENESDADHYEVLFSPDEKYIVLGNDRRKHVFSIAQDGKLELVTVLKAEVEIPSLVGAAFSKDSSSLMIAGSIAGAAEVKTWALKLSELGKKPEPVQQSAPVTALPQMSTLLKSKKPTLTGMFTKLPRFSRDGTKLIAEVSGKTVVYSANDGAPIGQPLPLDESVIGEMVSEDGEAAIQVLSDGSIKVMSLKTQLPIGQLESAQTTVLKEGPVSVALFPDHKRIAVLTRAKCLHVIDLTTQEIVRTIAHSWGLASQLQISSDGRRIVAWSLWDGIIHSYDAEVGAQQQDLLSGVGVGQDISNVFISNDDQMMAITLNDTIRIVDRASNRIVSQIRGVNPESIAQIAFSPDRSRFLVLQGERPGGLAHVTVYETQTGAQSQHWLARALDARFANQGSDVVALVVQQDGSVTLETLLKSAEPAQEPAKKPEESTKSSESQGIMHPTLDW